MNNLKILILAVIILLQLGCSRNETDIDIGLSSLLPIQENNKQDDQADSEWTKAINPREFNFPEDHGSHDDFRIEWWYYTGNLTSEDNRSFGYQLTFFRTGAQRETDNPSRWTVRNLYTVHFALSDIDKETHYSMQNVRRAGIQAAGATTDKLEVWNGKCRLEEQDGKHRLQAIDDDFEIDLTLEAGKGVALQGDQGLSQKGAAEGNASYYYSMPRMPTSGTVSVGNKSYEVIGESWMDHEFSTSFLERGQRGWDWLSLQLDDGSELMLYQMRRSDGSADPYSSGMHLGQDGTKTELSSEDFLLTPSKTWRSAETGAKYPLHWEVEVQPLGLKLNVTPAFQSQEMTTEATTGIAYWEGSISVDGAINNQPVEGKGYLELTGYTNTELGSMLKSN